MPVHPKVSVVMLLSSGRDAMQVRARNSIQAQTYPNLELVALDTAPYVGHTIGYIRNVANAYATGEMIAHADDDDISHPRRIEEQAALLLASGKQCVGYRELLFWDTRNKFPKSTIGGMPANEAWLYRNHQANWAAGASLLYRRELWERQPFDDAPHEDMRWMRTPLVSRECLSVGTHIPLLAGSEFGREPDPHPRPAEPRIVCGIHASNTEGYDRAVMLRNPDVWRRAPEFDAYCERAMRL